MSQPEHNMNKQVRRHKGPLLGITAVLVFAGIALIWWLFYEVEQADPPQGAATQVDGRTGETTDGTGSADDADPDGAVGPPATSPEGTVTGPDDPAARANDPDT